MVTKARRSVLLIMIGKTLAFLGLTSTDGFNQTLKISIDDEWYFFGTIMILEFDETSLFRHFDKFIALAILFMNLQCLFCGKTFVHLKQISFAPSCFESCFDTNLLIFLIKQ